jgi:hypothetical protein
METQTTNMHSSKAEDRIVDAWDKSVTNQLTITHLMTKEDLMETDFGIKMGNYIV